MSSRNWIVAVVVAAGLGLLFASVSTYDFAQHLDRQVHGVHCSFVPGLAAADLSGTSGCHVAMMSPYSSLLRSALWGGVPISLPAMSVFAFLLFCAVRVLLGRRTEDVDATKLLFLVTLVPVCASLIMGVIALVELGAACRLCIGIYAASAVSCIGAFVVWRRGVTAQRLAEFAPDAPADDAASDVAPPDRSSAMPALFGLGLLFVAAPALAYVALAPSHDEYITACGALDYPKDRYNVMLPLEQGGGVPVVEVLDPLCPACRAFEQRFMMSPAQPALSRQAVLFPLDSTCNWMIESTVHPGACTVSEAMLCAGKKAGDVLAWAFDQQDAIRNGEAEHPGTALKLVRAKFPQLKSCVGSSAVRSRLNRALRWAVKNRLRVLTPQFYVAGVRLCDEDVDLGLDYALSRMVDAYKKGTLPIPVEKPEPDRFAESPLLQAPEVVAPAAAQEDEEQPAEQADDAAADEDDSDRAALPGEAPDKAPVVTDTEAPNDDNPGDDAHRATPPAPPPPPPPEAEPEDQPAPDEVTP